jgi:hypothetical protein
MAAAPAAVPAPGLVVASSAPAFVFSFSHCSYSLVVVVMTYVIHKSLIVLDDLDISKIYR